MNVGANSSKKTWVAIGLAVIAVLLTARMIISTFLSPETTAATSTTVASNTAPRPAERPAPQRRVRNSKVTTGAATPNLDPRLHLALLKETETTPYTGEGRNIFKAQAEDVVIPKPAGSGLIANKPPEQPPPPPAYTQPPPPPINLKFFGFASQEGAKSVFLSSGEDVFIAKEGEIVQRRYKIVKINPTSIEVMDVLNNNQQTIPLTAG